MGIPPKGKDPRKLISSSPSYSTQPQMGIRQQYQICCVTCAVVRRTELCSKNIVGRCNAKPTSQPTEPKGKHDGDHSLSVKRSEAKHLHRPAVFNPCSTRDGLKAGSDGRRVSFLTLTVGQRSKEVSVERLELSTNGLKGHYPKTAPDVQETMNLRQSVGRL
jgi:hypothetical protein